MQSSPFRLWRAIEHRRVAAIGQSDRPESRLPTIGRREDQLGSGELEIGHEALRILREAVSHATHRQAPRRRDSRVIYQLEFALRLETCERFQFAAVDRLL